jgi:hypothetical protein
VAIGKFPGALREWPPYQGDLTGMLYHAADKCAVLDLWLPTKGGFNIEAPHSHRQIHSVCLLYSAHFRGALHLAPKPMTP